MVALNCDIILIFYKYFIKFPITGKEKIVRQDKNDIIML